MKKLCAILVLVAFAMSGVAQEPHFDFSVVGSTGYKIFYRIVDDSTHQVEVTYPCQHEDNYWWGYDKPEGKLMLVDTVAFNGTSYVVVSIGDHAFSGCSDLRGVLELPSTVQSIGACAFKDCVNLNGSLYLPAAMKRIEDETFSGCSSFTGKLVLPDSVQYVGNQAFLHCSGFTGMMMLPATLTFIGKQAFKGCSGINSMSVKTVTVPTTATDAFDDIHSWITVNVPFNTQESYQNAPGWSRFAHHTVEKSIWTGNAEPWTKGSGTTDDPYLIESAENLAWLAKSVNERKNMTVGTGTSSGGGTYYIYSFYDSFVYQDTCFKLVVDISLNKGECYWNPIGNPNLINLNQFLLYAPHHINDVFGRPHYYYLNYFSGQFDGDHHVISKVQYTNSFDGMDVIGSAFRIGFFGFMRDATIFNLTLDDILAGTNAGIVTGGLAGSAIKSNIATIHISGKFSQGRICGGIAGIAQQSVIKGCTTQMDINGGTVGGIVGKFVCDTAIGAMDGVYNCRSFGNINNAYLAGGVVAICRGVIEDKGVLRIENSFSKGTMTRICPDPPHIVESGNFIFGGIVGQVENIDTLYILNCYTNNNINTVPSNGGNHQYYGGGILAYSDVNSTISIKNCYHVGPIVTQRNGGILAQNTNMTLVRNCFFESSCAPDDGFGIPLEDDYLKTEAFVNQLNNGSSVFKMDTDPYENDGYPVFGTDGLIFVGAEWYYEINNPDGNVTYQHLVCSGDTTVNEKKAKVIVRTNQIYDKKDQTVITRECVYEENGVVYWWNATKGKFTVLYDFGAEVGDEWTIEVGEETIKTKVYAIDLQYINGIPYKKLTIADPDDIFSGVLLSDIGHQNSFFPEKLMTKSKGYRVEGLRCYWLHNELILHVGDMDCDEVYNQWHHNVDENLTTDFKIYPNPSNGLLYIETVQATSLPEPTEYRITNLMGQPLMTGIIKDQSIDISALPSGIYFFSMIGQTIKLMKQ